MSELYLQSHCIPILNKKARQISLQGWNAMKEVPYREFPLWSNFLHAFVKFYDFKWAYVHGYNLSDLGMLVIRPMNITSFECPPLFPTFLFCILLLPCPLLSCIAVHRLYHMIVMWMCFVLPLSPE